MRKFVCLAALAMSWAAAAEPPAGAFTMAEVIRNVKISPDGRYIAAEVVKDGQSLLIIKPLADGTGRPVFVRPANQASVGDYFWAGPKRVIMALAEGYENLEQPAYTGELYAANADGTDQKYLFGYRAPEAIGSNIRQVTKTFAGASVVRTLPDDPEHIIVSIVDWDNTSIDNMVPRAAKLNVENGLISGEVGAPEQGEWHFVASRSGEIRYAVGIDRNRDAYSYQRTAAGEWKPMGSAGHGANVEPLGLSPDESSVYLRSTDNSDRTCLIDQTLVGGERHRLSCDDTADLSHVIYSFDDKKLPIAAVYEAGRPDVRLLDTSSPDRARLAALEQAIGDEIVEPVSSTADGSKVVLHVYSDRDPGAYHILDTKTMHTDFFAPTITGVDPEQMSERRPIAFKARDGQMLHGFLTLPKGKDPKNLPLVVYPHGGPFEIADHWRWDPEAQLLASRGYAVLQVNFRGSSGYGYRFYRAGREGWNTVMIDDITDGARWTASQGFADAGRMCIYGTSYGGYAALASAVKEPDLYKCVVAFAGPYDLNLMRNESDVGQSRSGRDFIKDFVGATPEALKEASPLIHIDRLKAAIMIVHGKRDERVPFSEAEALRKALDQRHYPYEWLVKADEGHGFYLPGNRLDFYNKMLAFLDKNIGASAVPAPAAPAAGNTPASGEAAAAAAAPAAPADAAAAKP